MLIKVKIKVKKRAGIAQLVEQWTENPRVTSSSLVPGIVNSYKTTQFSRTQTPFRFGFLVFLSKFSPTFWSAFSVLDLRIME